MPAGAFRSGDSLLCARTRVAVVDDGTDAAAVPGGRPVSRKTLTSNASHEGRPLERQPSDVGHSLLPVMRGRRSEGREESRRARQRWNGQERRGRSGMEWKEKGEADEV
eukprot:750550-Hanusia_phi.AAC.1